MQKSAIVHVIELDIWSNTLFCVVDSVHIVAVASRRFIFRSTKNDVLQGKKGTEHLTSRVQPTAERRGGCTGNVRRLQTGRGHMDGEESLRTHLGKLLNWEDAHVSFDAAVKGIPPALRGIVPERLPYSPWQLLEHLRLTQRDILEFCRSPKYVEPSPQEYWPASAVPPTAAVWDESVTGFCRDREALKRLAADPAVDLFECIPHGTGQTYLRELLLVADHNAYHVAQLVVVRRCLGIWNPG